MSNARNSHDLDYQLGKIEAFIDEFKNKKMKELEDKNKNLNNQPIILKK